MENSKGGSMITGRQMEYPNVPPAQVLDSDKQLYEYRFDKLQRAGFSKEAATMIAAEIYVVIDSDEAIKLLRGFEESKVYETPELGVLYFLDLLDDAPMRN